MGEPKAIYTAINAISKDILAGGGIAKNRVNEGQHFKFRGVEDVMNTLAPLLVNHKVVLVPRVLDMNAVERQSSKGTALFFSYLDMEFDFISAEDGSSVTARVRGEGQDSGDKATNKAMSAAFKYAITMTFCIPTAVDDSDADEEQQESITRRASTQQRLATTESGNGKAPPPPAAKQESFKVEWERSDAVKAFYEWAVNSKFEEKGKRNKIDFLAYKNGIGVVDAETVGQLKELITKEMEVAHV